MNFKSLDSSYSKTIAEFFSKNFSDGWSEDMLLSAFSSRDFFAVGAFTVLMVLGRLISGVHWLTDIIGAALLSAGLVLLYDAFCRLTQK